MKKDEAFQLFVAELQQRLPHALIRPIPPRGGVDYAVRIDVPFGEAHTAREVASSLEYDWDERYGIFIQSSVSAGIPATSER